MKKLAEFIVDKRKLVVAVFLILAVVSAVLTNFVTVNNDMTVYLPEDSEAKNGVGIMNENFAETNTITVMFHDLTEEQKSNVYDQLEAIEQVDSVTYEKDSEDYDKDGYTRYIVSILGDSYSKAAKQVLTDIQDQFQEYERYVSGEVVDNQNNEMVIITSLALALLIVILFIMCKSFMEPILIMVSIGISVIISMGTNAMFSSVSATTYSIAAVLLLLPVVL